MLAGVLSDSARSSSDSPAPDALEPRRVMGGFRNPGRHDDRSWLDVLRWKLSTRAARWPRLPAPAPGDAPAAPESGFVVAWIGHASFLVRAPGLSLLLDPVWSERAGPLGLLGPRRARPPAIRFESLPPIDAVLLSHDHYDHCDLPTLRRLADEHPNARLFTPVGHADIARRAGFAGERHVERGWWESSGALPGARLTATPARHWGNRLSGRRNQRLWCGWHLDFGDKRLLFVGDTAQDEVFFPAIRQRLGAPDLALVPIGAYAPRWFMREQHCDPEEAVAIARALGARRAFGMHWGTFPLTDEPHDEPPARLERAAREAGLAPDAFVAPPPGAIVRVP